ncbi:unnamed protein product [Triticum turgidum subsp. durum]|uniref:Glyoxal oxidase N-terminal domain-containing protein n=1 Tax=Triticum turgidum subsp. durum TaxID=4567 RepID=A0A9R0VVC7_TRITD|nr:unnamed protein product [Triticum turgidum subsp. durum]
MKPPPALLTRGLALVLALACAGIAPASGGGAGGGRWDVLQRSIGVSAMHMQLLHNDRVIIFDRTDFGPSNLSLPDGRCRRNPRERVLPVDCTAHSAEYDVASNTFRPLSVFTDTWQFNYEFFPKADASDASAIALPFLVQTRDPEENNLYPFVHLNIDGNLFIFAKNRAVLLDYRKNKIVRTYPELAGGDPRNYPSSGSSVLLPLKPSPTEAEVLVCGGAPAGSYNSTKEKTFFPALVTCGRIKITDASPAWVIERMPSPRVMGDMILLPNGAEVAIINGAMDGTAGWEAASTPAYAPVMYRPDHAPGDRFEEQSATDIARLYHSAAILLRDGRVLVGGSNPHIYYNFSNVRYPTELSLEAFSPEYLDSSNDALRPKITDPSPAGPALYRACVRAWRRPIESGRTERAEGEECV